MTTLPLPVEYTYGKVVCRIIHAVADTTADEDHLPEAKGASGKIRFTPAVAQRIVTTAPTAFVQHGPITANLNASGVMVDEHGTPGVWLVSGVYRVEFQLTSGSVPAFSVEVTAAHTDGDPLDLVTVAPYVPPAATPVTTLVVPADPGEGQALGWGGGGLAWVDGAAAASSSAAAAAGSASAASASATAAATSATTAQNAATTAAIGGFLSGTGSPQGVVAAPVGSQYRDTAVTTGALIWVKASGTGTTGWVVQHGDTGWRDISSLRDAAWVAASSAPVFRICRTGNEVYFEGRIAVASGSSLIGTARNTLAIVLSLPAGFQPGAYVPLGVVTLGASGTAQGVITAAASPAVPRINFPGVTGTWAAGEMVAFSATWCTTQAWPTTLPGTPTA